MTKLKDGQIDFIRLINRSPADTEGWKKVSSTLCRMFDPDWPHAIPQDFYEFEKLEDGGRVRFTERGQAVADYA